MSVQSGKDVCGEVTDFLTSNFQVESFIDQASTNSLVTYHFADENNFLLAHTVSIKKDSETYAEPIAIDIRLDLLGSAQGLGKLGHLLNCQKHLRAG